MSGVVALLVALAGGALTAGSGFTEVTDLPDGEATHTYALLGQRGAEST